MRMLAVFIVLLACSTTFAQEPATAEDYYKLHDADWEFVKDSDLDKHIVYVKSDDEAWGTGSIVDSWDRRGKRYGIILTARHNINDDDWQAEKIEIGFKGGEKSNGTINQYCVIYAPNGHDAAALFTEIPKGYSHVEIGAEPSKGDEITVIGLGGPSWVPKFKFLRHYRSKIKRRHSGYVFFDEESLMGDSGGPIFNSKGQVVSVVSGGWNVATREGCVWPSCGVQPVQVRKLVKYASRIARAK